MVPLKHTWAATLCCAILVLSSLQQLTAAHSHSHSHSHSHQHGAAAAAAGSASYIDAYGQHSTLAARLAELVEAEEPLNPEDVARLAAAVK
jgi:hypothetical protein